MRVGGERIELRSAEGHGRVEHQIEILHRSIARFVRLSAEQGKVRWRLVLEKRNLVEPRAQRCFAIAVFRGQIQEARRADAEAGVRGGQHRLAVVDVLASGCEIGHVLAVGDDRLAAFACILEHNVDHAGDGVGPVLRGGAVTQHLDALDGPGRNVVEIDRARALAELRFGGERCGRVPALAVDQHQRLIGAQAAQLRWPHQVREVGIGLARQIEGRHQGLQRRAYLTRDCCGLPDLRGTDDVDWHRTFVHAAAGRARADDHYFSQCGVLVGRDCTDRCGQAERQRANDHSPVRMLIIGHETPLHRFPEIRMLHSGPEDTWCCSAKLPWLTASETLSTLLM